MKPDLAQMVANEIAGAIGDIQATQKIYDRLLKLNLVIGDEFPPFLSEKARIRLTRHAVEISITMDGNGPQLTLAYGSEVHRRSGISDTYRMLREVAQAILEHHGKKYDVQQYAEPVELPREPFPNGLLAKMRLREEAKIFSFARLVDYTTLERRTVAAARGGLEEARRGLLSVLAQRVYNSTE